jgi:hypothetical protein
MPGRQAMASHRTILPTAESLLNTTSPESVTSKSKPTGRGKEVGEDIPLTTTADILPPTDPSPATYSSYGTGQQWALPVKGRRVVQTVLL